MPCFALNFLCDLLTLLPFIAWMKNLTLKIFVFFPQTFLQLLNHFSIMPSVSSLGL